MKKILIAVAIVMLAATAAQAKKRDEVAYKACIESGLRAQGTGSTGTLLVTSAAEKAQVNISKGYLPEKEFIRLIKAVREICNEASIMHLE